MKRGEKEREKKKERKKREIGERGTYPIFNSIQSNTNIGRVGRV